MTYLQKQWISVRIAKELGMKTIKDAHGLISSKYVNAICVTNKKILGVKYLFLLLHEYWFK